MGAESLRGGPEGQVSEMPGIRQAILEAVGKVFDYGKSAVAEIGSRGIENLEYKLFDDRLESSGFSKPLKYEDISRIEVTKKATFKLISSTGTTVIKPYAWLQVASVKVPLGWIRNGMEAPYELLVEEIAARSKASIRAV